MRIISGCLLLLMTSVVANAADATGYVWHQCPFTGPSVLHLQKFKGHKLRPEMAIRIPEQHFWWGLGDAWSDYDGLECLGGECQPTRHSKVKLHVSYGPFFVPRRWKWKTTTVSGSFDVELSDGRKISGSFKARVRLRGLKLALCA